MRICDYCKNPKEHAVHMRVIVAEDGSEDNFDICTECRRKLKWCIGHLSNGKPPKFPRMEDAK